jgi:hypothetical protein
MRKNKINLVIILIFCMSNISSAAVVDLISPDKLPIQLREGDQVNLSIKITDYNDDKYITLETSLIQFGDKPIYDFGELNKYINENRYESKMTLNVSSLPQKAFLDISISGKAPYGETAIKCDNIIITKFDQTKLKFYEVHVDEKLVGIESFELIINKRQEFEETLQKIRISEFDGMKNDIRNLFNMGIVVEAQNIANEMSGIKWPGSMTLFGIIEIKSDIILDVIFIIVAIFMFIIGYIFGSRDIDKNEQNED